ncbi:MAG: TonB-dependent receptor plug domain-containing protein, partial [Gammaproteobacteria bacterium]|nr:TonB-dependent receptor plug domain-containing protein [Gemmatimonadota bacterium]NIU78534.1 TonB-dependent receptor plug domain-containing protein [Gammaproteobacteria bacterium]
LALPLDRVERVEVLRGPASALYGADAMGGVVNVVTRDAGAPWRTRIE